MFCGYWNEWASCSSVKEVGEDLCWFSCPTYILQFSSVFGPNFLLQGNNPPHRYSNAKLVNNDQGRGPSPSYTTETSRGKESWAEGLKAENSSRPFTLVVVPWQRYVGMYLPDQYVINSSLHTEAPRVGTSYLPFVPATTTSDATQVSALCQALLFSFFFHPMSYPIPSNDFLSRLSKQQLVPAALPPKNYNQGRNGWNAIRGQVCWSLHWKSFCFCFW